jgi:hypothetical protein
MKRAGCHQVRIPIESVSQMLLDDSWCRPTVEANQRALENCKKAGLTSLATLILGIPGESAATIDDTFEMLREAPPDAYSALPFTGELEDLPEVTPHRFGLITATVGASLYWRHDTMSCTEIGRHLRRFNQRMMRERVAVNAQLLYRGLLEYSPDDKGALLDFQEDVVRGHRLLHGVFERLIRWSEKKLEAEVERRIGTPLNAGALTISGPSGVATIADPA